MRSIIDQQLSKSVYAHPDRSVMEMSERSLDALWKRLEVAESTVRSLERENEQLRAERARAVLAAARATEESNGERRPAANESGSNFEALTKELKIAEAARADAARDRQAAIDAVREALKKEYSQRITSFQEKHADDLVALSAMAEKQARDAVAKEFDALASKANDAKQALDTAKRKSENDLRTLELELGKKYGEEIEALHRHYAAILENLSRQKKEQYATELMSALSSARASWQEDTAKQLRRATNAAAKAIEGQHTRWQRHQKMMLRRAARVWRRRERRRLLEAREHWNSAQRRAIDACNGRWQSKFDRLRKQAHLISLCSRASTAIWENIKSCTISFTSLLTTENGQAACLNDPTRPTRIQASLMAALLIFLGINFSLTAGLPTSSTRPALDAPDEKATSASQVASVPAGGARATPAARSVVGKEVKSGKSGTGKSAVSPNSGVDWVGSPPNKGSGEAATTTKPVPQQSTRQTVVRPDKRSAEQVVRERLRENIRNLRMGSRAN